MRMTFHGMARIVSRSSAERLTMTSVAAVKAAKPRFNPGNASAATIRPMMATSVRI